MSSDTPPISFTEDGLDKFTEDLLDRIEAELRSPRTYRWYPLAADAIRYLRRERVPPTSEEAREAAIICRQAGFDLHGSEADNEAMDLATRVTLVGDFVERQSRRIAEQDRRINELKDGAADIIIARDKRLAELQRALVEIRDGADGYVSESPAMRVAYRMAKIANAALAAAQPSEG